MIRRVLAAAVLLVVAAALLAVTWPQLFGLHKTAIVAQLVSLRGLAVAGAAIAALILLLMALTNRTIRRFTGSLSLVLIIFVAANTVVLASRGAGGNAIAIAAPSTITVLSWNTLGDAPGAKAIAALAVETGADIVSLPETTSETAIAVAELMRAAGRPMWAHTFHYDLISKARSTSLLTSVDLGIYDVDTDHRTTQVLPTIVATPQSGNGPTIIAVHAVAPIPSELNRWKLDLRWLAHACSGGSVIMAGDFNATIDHLAGLDSVAGATLGDCFDAGLASGNGALGTWPTALPPLLGAPIDHVMATSQWTVTGMRVVETLDHAGSDHRPIVVQLSSKGGQ